MHLARYRLLAPLESLSSVVIKVYVYMCSFILLSTSNSSHILQDHPLHSVLYSNIQIIYNSISEIVQ